MSLHFYNLLKLILYFHCQVVLIYLYKYNNNITTGFEVEKYCSDTKEDIKDALLKLRIAKYIRYNSETNMLEANAVPYDKWNEEEYEL